MNVEIKHIRELIKQHNEMTQLAIDKAENTMNARLEGLNEFRAQQADTITRFATMERLNSAIDAFTIHFTALEKDVDDLREWKSNMQGRNAVVQIIWPLIVGTIVFILTHFFK